MKLYEKKFLFSRAVNASLIWLAASLIARSDAVDYLLYIKK